MANEEENNKSDLMRFKNFKDMDNWSGEDQTKYKFPGYKYKHENTPLLDFLHEHGFSVDISHMTNKPRVEKYPYETGNAFHIEIDRKLTKENIREYIIEEEGLEDDVDDETYNNYSKGYNLDESILEEDPIQFHVFLAVSPNQIENPLFKEECLKIVRQELANMLKSKTIDNLTSQWNYGDSSGYQEEFINFMNIQDIHVRSNKEIVNVFNTDERLYLNSKVLSQVEMNNLTDILKEFMTI